MEITKTEYYVSLRRVRFGEGMQTGQIRVLVGEGRAAYI